MVASSMMAVFLAFGAAGQVPERPGEWVVIASKDGPFSFAMPARPVERGGEAPAEKGPMRWKMYTYQKGDDILIFRQQIFPPGGAPGSPFGAVEVPEKIPGVTFTKSPIEVRGASGMELVERTESRAGDAGVRSRIRVMVQGPIVYTIVARSGSGRTIPADAAGFFDSLRFDGTQATAAGKAAAQAGRKQIGKVVREDRTADAAVRTFLMAMEAGDEETLRAVTLPNPDIAWLLRGEATIIRDFKELEARVRKARIERLRPGDRVQIARGESHEILPSEVGRDRAALRIHGSPAYAPLQLVKGRWKVNPAPIIAARKAAEVAK